MFRRKKEAVVVEAYLAEGDGMAGGFGGESELFEGGEEGGGAGRVGCEVFGGTGVDADCCVAEASWEANSVSFVFLQAGLYSSICWRELGWLRCSCASSIAFCDSSKLDPVIMNFLQPTATARWRTSSKSSGWACFPWYTPRKTGSPRLIPICSLLI